MTLAEYSNGGERWDLELRQGATFGPVRHTLLNPDLTPVNLAGFSVRGQVRRKALAADPAAADFVTTIAPTPADGWYEFGLTDETTGALPCGGTPGAPESAYEYDVELVDAAGRVICTLWGELRIKAEVTRL